MSFVQSEFLILFSTVLVLYWQLPRRAQNFLLVAASLVFYGWVHLWFVGLLLYSALLDWTASNAMVRFADWKLTWLRVSLVSNALLLGAFKYLDFFIENVAAALVPMGLGDDLHVLGIILPVGISFYTFQTMSYTIDVYRGDVEPEPSFLTFLNYVCFFPQLVAGPIERAADLLPQFHRDRVFDWWKLRSGLSLALWGVFKKVVIADTAAPYVNTIFAAELPSNAMAWAATFGFMVQMLADFSAYSDIARGTARMLGFQLSVNFDHPYLAASPVEFWQRWHITFSNWLRDYVFYTVYDWRWGRRWLRIIGLPDSVRIRVAQAALLTMLFSGLWHGAAWHFVLWGALWGVAQILWDVAARLAPASLRRSRFAGVLGISLMLAIQLLAHLVFREPELARIGGRLSSSPLAGTADELVVATLMLAVAAAGAAILVIAMWCERTVIPRLEQAGLWTVVEPSLWAAASWLVLVFARQTQADFLYFAF